MSCNLCCNDSTYKILNSCPNRRSNRYEYYCGECFMNQYENGTCKNQDKCVNAFVISEFTWINAYECAINLRKAFPTSLRENNQDVENMGFLPVADQDSFDDSIDSEDTAKLPPYCFPSFENDVDDKYLKMDICFYIKKDDKNCYISREGLNWIIAKNPQKITAGIKRDSNEIRIFISKFHFDISRKKIILVKYNSRKRLGDIPKFMVENQRKMLKFDGKILRFKSGEITIEDEGYSIYWKKY